MLAAVLLALAAACGGDDAGADADADADVGGEGFTRFCAAMDTISNGANPSLDELEAAYEEVLATVPSEVRDDAEEVIPLLRSISQRFAVLPADADPDSVMAEMSEDERQIVQDLAATQQSGSLPDTALGRLLGLAVGSCPAT